MLYKKTPTPKNHRKKFPPHDFRISGIFTSLVLGSRSVSGRPWTNSWHTSDTICSLMVGLCWLVPNAASYVLSTSLTSNPADALMRFVTAAQHPGNPCYPSFFPNSDQEYCDPWGVSLLTKFHLLQLFEDPHPPLQLLVPFWRQVRLVVKKGIKPH